MELSEVVEWAREIVENSSDVTPKEEEIATAIIFLYEED